MKPRLSRTKIIATLGPATRSPEVLGELFDWGVAVCRINLSHGERPELDHLVNLVRSVAKERAVPGAILADLGGPKIRLRCPGGPRVLQTGQALRIVRDARQAGAGDLWTTYDKFVDEVASGHRIYIDDGLVRLLVIERAANVLDCVCTTPGTISDRKGINLPDTRLTLPSLTAKDHEDIRWGAAHGIDYFGLSFVRQPSDVVELRERLKAVGSQAGVIAKIEKVEALESLPEIVSLSDAVMVARGDLGVEMDVWQVPVTQKAIIANCRQQGKPVIVATQMLQSMISSPMPTRAEVNDVAGAIFDAADAVMLSAETATGQYPARAVEIMQRVASVSEEFLRSQPERRPSARGLTTGDARAAAVAYAAVQAALHVNARALAVWSASGETLRMVAQYRLPVPVIGLTAEEQVCRRVSLFYGVLPVPMAPVANPSIMAKAMDARLLELGLVAPGDVVVVVTSTRPAESGNTDTTLIHRVGD